MFKKVIAPIVAIVLALGIVGASAGAAFAAAPVNENNENCSSETITHGEKVSFSSGNLGIFMPSSMYAGELEICRNSTLRPERNKDVGLMFVSPIVYWDVEKTENTSQAYVGGNNRVIFSTPSYQTAYTNAFKSGELAIYFWNTTSKTWEKLPTTATANGFTAHAMGFGYYALGRLLPASQ